MPSQPQPIKNESINLDVHGCRLCLSEESLDHVFKEDHLREWIMDLLSIEISNDDGMSHVICAICRIRLSEFHQFRIRCQEVQEVLKAIRQDKPVGVKNAHVKPEPDESFVSLMERKKPGLVSSNTSVDTDNGYSETEEDPLCFESFAKLDEASDTSLHNEEMEIDPIGAEDSIDVEEAKVETWLDNDSELSNEHTKEYVVHTQKSKQVSDPKKEDTGSVNKVKEIPPSRGIAHHSKDVDQSTDFKCLICEMEFSKRALMRQHLYTKKHLNNLKQKRENVSPKNGTVESNETDSSQQKDKVVSDQTDNANTGTNDQKRDDSSLMKDDINFDVYKSRRLHRGSSVEQGQCDVCHKVFPTKYSLSNHKKYHKPKKFVCHVCEKPCHNAAILKKHIVTHEPIAQRQQANPPIDPDSIPRPYKCDICKTAYKTNSTLWQHNKLKHAPKIHECDICGKKFGTSDMLNRHIRMHNARGHTKEDFLSLKMLMRTEDTSTKQNDGDEKSDEEVSDNENAHSHRSSDYVQKSSKASSELPFQCDVCHESFPTRVLLYRHKRNLHKRFKCSVCDKHFAYRKQRRMHMRVHDSGSKSSNDFECAECHKIYASWKSLFAHVSNGHVKRKKLSEERTIACPKCDKMFQTVHQRDLHMRTVHLPEKHRCTVCDKLFTVRVQLWQHMKTQHGGSSPGNSESDDSEGSLELSVQKYISKDKPDRETCQAASRKQPRRNAKLKNVESNCELSQ